MRRGIFVAIVSGFFTTAALGDAAPKTFFRDGVWAPLYGDLGFNAASLGGVDVTLDHLKFGIQLFRLGDFALTGGYGVVGATGGPWQKKDAPKKYRAHFHGPIGEVHYLPDFFMHGSLSFASMTGTTHYEDTAAATPEELNVTHNGSLTDILATLNVRVWTDVYASIGFGSRSSKLNGDDINLEMGEQSSGLIVIGVRGSTL